MDIIDAEKYGQAFKNVKDFNFTQMSYGELFDLLKDDLVCAFDAVTTFDMRSPDQIELDLQYCDIGLVDEKDFKTYPAVVLGIKIVDWDVRNQCKAVWRKAYFQLKLIPFRCGLDKLDEMTGVYGGYDKELTIVWRKLLKEKYPAWEEAFQQYLLDVRNNKVETAKRQCDAARMQADKEYDEEFASLY